MLVEAGAKVIFTARQRAIADAVAEEIQAQGLQVTLSLFCISSHRCPSEQTAATIVFSL